MIYKNLHFQLCIYRQSADEKNKISANTERANEAFQMMWQFQRRVVRAVVRMKSSSSREEAATATCTVPFFSPRDYTRHIR